MKSGNTIKDASSARSQTPFFSKERQQGFFSGGAMEGGSFFGRTPAAPPPVQTKLKVGEPDDMYEKEADATADKVVQRLSAGDGRIQAKTDEGMVQRKCASCEAEEKLQRKPIFESEAAEEEEAPVQRKTTGPSDEHLGHIEPGLQASKGGGAPLPKDTKQQMESSFGADFSQVRVHDDGNAVQMSKELNAQAFTNGNDIYFNQGKYDTDSKSGQHLLAHELAHTIQQNGGAGNSIQPRLFDDRTERQKVEDALKSKDAGDVKDIDNVYAATEAERIDLLKILVDQWWAGNSDEKMMERIWDSFGFKIFLIASQHMDLWKQCVDKGADLDELDEVKKAKKKFGEDVKALAKQYLALNRTYTEEELQSLGLKNTGNTTDEDKDIAMNEVRLAAELVKKAQDGQAILKGMRIVGTNSSPVWDFSGRVRFDPAYFNPEKRPDNEHREKGEENLATWDEVKKQYDRLTGTILGLSNQYPSIYALVRDEKVGEFTKADSAQAKAIVNQSLNNVLKYIGITIDKINDNDITFYDLIPIHAQLFDGSKKGPSGIDWTNEAYKWAAQDDISRHESKEFWITIGLATLAAAAFVVAELATAGSATFFIAAGIGVGIGAGQAVNSWDHYRNLAAASKSNVNDETALVTSGQASAALFEAIVNTAFVFIDLYAPLAKGIKAGAKVAEGAAEAGAKAAGKEALEKAEKDLAAQAAEEAAQKSAEKQAAEKLAKEVGENSGKALSKGVLESLKDILKEFTESVKKWARWVFDKLGFKSYEVIDEGEYLVLYGIRSRVMLARFRKDSLEKFIVDKDETISKLLKNRSTKLAKGRAARLAGDDLLGYALRKEGIEMSEKLGEEVAQSVVAQKFPAAVLLHIGEGSGTLDLIYKLGPGEFLVVEAKGAGGKLGTRVIAGVEVQQGSKTYLRDVLKNMAERGLKKGATLEEKAGAKVANDALNALNKGNVRYGLVKAPIPKPGENFLQAAYREFLIM